MAPSLCVSCVFVRRVRGRENQRYLLCRNPAIDAKYPRQPVLECGGYARADAPPDVEAESPASR